MNTSTGSNAHLGFFVDPLEVRLNPHMGGKISTRFVPFDRQVQDVHQIQELWADGWQMSTKKEVKVPPRHPPRSLAHELK